MGKALMVGGIGENITNTGRLAFFGGSWQQSEQAAPTVATEAATFSNLRTSVTAGNSGTANFTFRKNGVSTSQAAVIAGIGSNEDTVDSDALVANDTFNFIETDSGTNPTVGTVAINVEFASGHGSFHGAAFIDTTALVFSSGAVTRYLPVNGLLNAAHTVEANAQMKTRGYTSVEAIQCRIGTNTNANDTTLTLRVNGVDRGTPITVSAGATGSFTVTGMGIGLADGDLIDLKIVNGGTSGAQVFRVQQVVATLKSTKGESQIFSGQSSGATRTASATPTYYAVGGGASSSATQTDRAVKVGFATPVSHLAIYLSANTYTGSATFKLFVNGSAALTTNIPAGTTGWLENVTDYVNIDDNDTLSFEIVGGSSGSITVHQMGIKFGIPVRGSPAGKAVFIGGQ